MCGASEIWVNCDWVTQTIQLRYLNRQGKMWKSYLFKKILNKMKVPKRVVVFFSLSLKKRHNFSTLGTTPPPPSPYPTHASSNPQIKCLHRENVNTWVFCFFVFFVCVCVFLLLLIPKERCQKMVKFSCCLALKHFQVLLPFFWKAYIFFAKQQQQQQQQKKTSIHKINSRGWYSHMTCFQI